MPHRPAHPRGPVGREDAGPAAVHDRPRERRLGARGRLRGHQRLRGRQGDRAPADHLRAVPRLPFRRRCALRVELLPGHRHQRRVRRVPEDVGAQCGEDRRLARARRRRGTCRRGPHRLPRRGEGCQAARTARQGRRHRRRRAGPHRYPGARGTDAGRVDRRRPQPGRSEAGAVHRRRTTPWSPTAPRSSRCSN